VTLPLDGARNLYEHHATSHHSSFLVVGSRAWRKAFNGKNISLHWVVSRTRFCEVHYDTRKGNFRGVGGKCNCTCQRRAPVFGARSLEMRDIAAIREGGVQRAPYDMDPSTMVDSRKRSQLKLEVGRVLSRGEDPPVRWLVRLKDSARSCYAYLSGGRQGYAGLATTIQDCKVFACWYNTQCHVDAMLLAAVSGRSVASRIRRPARGGHLLVHGYWRPSVVDTAANMKTL